METIEFNIHLLTIEEPSIGMMPLIGKKLLPQTKHQDFVEQVKMDISYYNPQHIYITSPSSPIKKGDWFINKDGLWQHNGVNQPDSTAQKIEITTDTLIGRENFYSSVKSFKDNIVPFPQPHKVWVDYFITQYNKGNLLKTCEVEAEFFTNSRNFYKNQPKDVVGCAIEKFPDKKVKVFADNCVNIIIRNGLWDEKNQYRINLLNEYAEKLVDRKSAISARVLLSHFMIDLEEQNAINGVTYNKEELHKQLDKFANWLWDMNYLKLYTQLPPFPSASSVTKEYIKVRLDAEPKTDKKC